MRKNFIWNSIAGIVNASEAVIVLAVVSRTNGLEAAGIVSLAFSIANLMITLGKFGVRDYQVTSGKEKYSFVSFLTFRIITVLFMLGVCGLYSIYGQNILGFSTYKGKVLFFVCIWYGVEAFEDVFAGLYQSEGRLDLGGKIFSVRWLGTIFTFCLSVIVTRDIFFSAIVASIISVFLCVLLLKLTYFGFSRIYGVTRKNVMKLDEVKKLFFHCLPLCISGFCSFYIINAPKYAISKYMTDKTQAIYGYLAMLVFVIPLLSSFLYQPLVVRFYILLKNREYHLFKKEIIRQIFAIVGITFCCILGSYFLGTQVLSWLYHEDLSSYKIQLCIILLAGSCSAIGSILGTIITIINKQKTALKVSIIAAFLVSRVLDVFVKKYGLNGAIIGFFCSMFGITIASGGIVLQFLYVKGKNKKESIKKRAGGKG